MEGSFQARSPSPVNCLVVRCSGATNDRKRPAVRVVSNCAAIVGSPDGGNAAEDVSIFVINAVLQSEKSVVSVRIEIPFNLTRCRNERVSILDIKAEESGGRLFDSV
jgi:hypothetical protein